MPALLLDGPDVTLDDVTSPSVNLSTLRKLTVLQTGVDVNKKFVNGDHWQGTDGWVGPGPRPSDPTWGEIMPLIEKAFVSRNVVDEIIDRHVSAMLGKMPRWGWGVARVLADEEEPNASEQTTINELDAATLTWWKRNEAHKLLKSLIYQMLWAQRSMWRLYVPSGLVKDGVLTVTDLPNAFSKLFLDIPDPENSVVWEDPETKTRVGIAFFKDGSTERAEVTFVDPDSGETVIRIVPPRETGKPEEIRLTMDGFITMFQVSLDALFISEQMRSLQKALNMTLTLLGKGFVDNAFLERLLLNALPPGHWEYEAELGPDGERVRKAFIPAKHVATGRTTSYIQGVDYENRKTDGTTVTKETVIKDPQVVFREYIDPDGIIKGSEFWYAQMLGEARQDHVLIQKEATPSGKSREQARGDFIDSTQDTELQSETAGETLLMTLLKFAEAFLKTPGKWSKNFKPVFKCRKSFGPLSVEERAQNISEAEAGYMADETAMELNGRDDVDEERARISAQPRAKLALSEARATVVDLWVGANFARETALFLAGFSDAEIKEIMKRESNAEPINPEANPGAKDPPAPEPAPASGDANGGE